MSMSASAARRSLKYWDERTHRFYRNWRGYVHKRSRSPRRGYWHARYKHAFVMRERRRKQLARAGSVSGISPEGLALIKRFEGFRAHPYRDAVGVWTIGYGETRNVGPGTGPWSEGRAAAALKARVNRDYLGPVLKLAKSTGLRLGRNEADALASLVYNLGPGILAADRTMGAALRSKDRQRIANAFLVYDKAGGRTLPGLTARRRAERALFLRK